MIKRLSASFASLVAALALGGCARNAYLEIRMDLPTAGAAVTTTTGSFQAQGAMIAVTRDDPGNTSQRVFSSGSGKTQINLATWDAATNLISVEATDDFSSPIYVVVRLCRTTGECDGASFNATSQRDFVWKIEHPHYKAKYTRITLPIPSGPAADPDNTTGFSSAPQNMFGCVLDDWAYVLPMAPPGSGVATPVELNRCFVYSPECREGLAWGCDSSLADGSPPVCDLEQTSVRHYCD